MSVTPKRLQSRGASRLHSSVCGTVRDWNVATLELRRLLL